MHFHGFHEVDGRHYMTITDREGREVVEVTGRERNIINMARARAYQTGFQSGLRGRWCYGPPPSWGVFGEAWAEGRPDGERKRLHRLALLEEMQ